MPYYVYLPDGRDVEFPDNYPRAEAMQVARDMLRPRREVTPVAPTPPEERSLLGGALSSGYNTAQSQGGSFVEGIGNVLGIESLRNWGAESRRRNAEEAERAMPASRRQSFEEANSVGDYARATGQAVASSLPATGLGLAGGIAGGAVGSLLGPAGTAAGAFGGRALGAFIGSSLASYPLFVGSNRSAQIEASTPRDAEGRPTGEGTVSSEGAAFGAAVPQAAMEGITDVILGGLGKFFRGGAEEVARSVLPRIARGIGVGAASEVPAEVGQQILERAQAGLDIFSPEAFREYREAAMAALAAGGVMGGTVGGVFGPRPASPAPRQTEDEQLRQSLQVIAQQRAAAAQTPAQPPAGTGPAQPPAPGVTPPAPSAPPSVAPPVAPPAQPPLPQAPPVVPPVAPPEAPPAAPQSPPVVPPVEPPVPPAAPVEPATAPPVEPAAAPAPAPITGFTTALGSTYEINEEGQTSRTKNSPGRGQGQTYEPHNVLFVDPVESENILNDLRAGNTYHFGVKEAGGTRALSPGESLSGKSAVLAVVSPTGELIRDVPAQAQPSVGLAPIELRYERGSNGELLSNRHIGNVITEVRGAAPETLVQPEAEEVSPPVEVAPIQPEPQVEPAVTDQTQQTINDEQDFPGITEELRKNIAAVNRAIRQVTGQRGKWQDLSFDQRADVYNVLQTQFSAAATPQAEPETTPQAAPEAEAETITAPDPVALANAERYVNEQIEAIRKTGKQGESIANALDDVVKDLGYHPMQIYGAIVAGNAMADVLPKNANHKIEFTKKLIEVKSTQENSASASGIKKGEFAGGQRDPVDQIIRISLAPEALREVRQTGAHEAFHVLQDYYAKYDRNFMKVANAAFVNNAPISSIDKTIKRKLQNIRLPANTILPKGNGNKKYETYWDVLEGFHGDKPISAREAQAYTYAALYDAARFGVPMTGLKPSMTRFVGFLQGFFSNVKNTLKGNGFNNANDLFSRAVEEGGSRFNKKQVIKALNQTSDGVEFSAVKDGNSYFRMNGLDVQETKNPRSRSTLTYMSPDDFLLMAHEGKNEIKTKGISELIQKGEKFSSLPSLGFNHDGKGNAKVKSHEGRHRAMALKELGVKSMPVILISREDGAGDGIRWGVQENPRERIKNPPKVLQGEDGRGSIPMPDSVVYPTQGRVEESTVAQATPKDSTEFAAARTNVNTPGFAEWFEGSEITDPDGPPVFFKGTKVLNTDMMPRIMYHGSGRMFKRFGKAKSGSDATGEGPFFFSESPAFASQYAKTDLSAGGKGKKVVAGGKVFPVYISAKNVFNPMNPSHRNKLMKYITDGLNDGTISFNDVKTGAITDSGIDEKFPSKDERIRYVIKKLSNEITDMGDNWYALEVKPVQRFIRENGYDGFYLRENNARNVAVFSPKQIKSIFNTFAPDVKDQTEFSAVASGATGGLPPVGQRVPPVTQTMANGTEMLIEYDVVAKAMSKRLGRYIEPAKVERFFTVFQDHMLPVARLVDYVNDNGGNVSQAMNTYVQQDLLSGRTADMLKQRNEGLYQKLINAIANSQVGMNDFENYLYARHAPERNDHIASINPEMPDGGSGMSYDTAEEIMNEFERAGKIPELERIAVMFDAIIADTNSLRVQYGLTPDFSQMTTDSEGRLLPNYRNYAPLKGFADESVDADESINEFRSKGSRMLGARGREDMQATGRVRMAGDIVAHAMMQNTQAVVRSQKNAVGQSFVAMIRANPNQTAGIAKILTRPMTRTAVVNGVVKVVPDIMYKGRPDILVVKEGGKETVVQIKDEAIARSMIGATSNAPTTNGTLIKGMIALNNILAKINTAYNPEFLITNFFRDLQTFGVNVEQFDVKGLRSDSIRDVRAAMAGVRDVVRGSNGNPEMAGYYNRLKELGGTNEAYGFADIDTRIKEINDTMASAGTTAKSWKDMAKVIAPVGKFIEDYNTIVENGIRVSVFKNMVQRGINEQQAAYIAKNVTVNFTKGGENRVFMNAMYLFYNASLQGTMAMVNAMGRSKKVRRIVAGIMVAGLMQDALNSILSGDDEDGEKIYDKIPDHILKRSFIMMDPFGLTERGYLSFPMPYGFNAFFNMGRELSKVARGASTPMDGAGNILGTFADAFNPVGGTNSFYNFVAPTIADPLIDIARNRDFADRPIVPERGGFGVQTPDSQKYWNNTFAPFVDIAGFLNELTGGTSVIPGAIDISPGMINYVFNFATGAAGKFVERTYTTVTTALPSMLAGDFSEIDAREIPVFRSVVGNVTTRNNMERYMERTQEVLQIRQEIRAANEAGDSERVAAALERYPGQVEIMDSINKLTRDRSKLAREINTISRNENIPEDIRRDIVKQLREQQNQLVNAANRLYAQRVTNRD